MALILLAMASMRDAVATVTEPSSALLGGLLLLLAAPTTWLFALFPVSAVVAVVLGIVTSLLLWFRLGSWLAHGTTSWAQWWRRYIVAALGSTIILTLIVAIIASFE